LPEAVDPDKVKATLANDRPKSSGEEAILPLLPPFLLPSDPLEGVHHKTKETSMIKLRPLNDRVMVKRLEEKEVKKGGIIIPDTAKEKPQEGEVIAVGPGKVTEDGKRQPMEVKVGDKILFGKYSGSEVKLGDEDFLIMREEDILGILQ
jgi:chaperonin GroES